MVFIAPFISAALLSGLAYALPRPGNPSPSLTGTQTAWSSDVTIPSNVGSYGSDNGYGSENSWGSDKNSPPIQNDGHGGKNKDLGAQSNWPAAPTATAAASDNGGYGGNNNQWGAQSSWSADATATAAANDNSGYGGNNKDLGAQSSWSAEATATASASASYSSPMYGSGSSNWGGSGYNDCVSQCIATFGAPPAAYTPTATASDQVATGTGATHTVIVAPTQGVLRYVPFAINASVGDTVKFMWGANNHTVTKSSALAPCNKSGDALFNTGPQSKDFVFTQVVNDTNPTFFYCGTPGHCQKGMFGIINPPSALGASTSVSAMMQPLAANNSDVSAYASYTTKMTANDTKAAGWGGNINLASLPEWSHSFVAENVLYTRNFLASNSEVMQDDGSIDLSGSGSTPLMIPQDISAVLASNSPAASPSPATSSAPAATSASTSGANAGAENLSNGAGLLASPNTLIGLLVGAVTFFTL